MTQEIPLSRGLVAIVDDEDFDAVVAVGKWYAQPAPKTFYAKKNFYVGLNRWTSLVMHTLILGEPGGDHVNGNGLDNRRSNLRPASKQQNNWNARRRSDNSSGYKGVGWRPRQNRWVARIRYDGKRRYLGMFPTAEEAALAYNAAAVELFGEFAYLNEV